MTERVEDEIKRLTTRLGQIAVRKLQFDKEEDAIMDRLRQLDPSMYSEDG